MKASDAVAGVRSRRGTVTVFVLVCLVIILATAGVLLQIGLAERNRVRSEERRVQAEWLLESGLERAVARLADDPTYHGETWELSADALRGPFGGRVTIALETLKEQPARRRLRVRADYPPEGTGRVRLTKQVIVEAASTPRG